MSDKLRVLVINDEREEHSPFDSLLEMVQVNEPEDAQSLLISAAGRPPFDIVVCDVNFEKSETVRSISGDYRGRSPAIVPLGPVLALPFLSSSTTVFVPYSSYWPTIRQDPDIVMLATLALIEAFDKREPVDLVDLREQYRADSGEPAAYRGTLAAALQEGLEKLRARMFASPDRIGNAGALADRLAALHREGGWIPGPFEQALGDIQCQIERKDASIAVHELLRDEEGALGLNLLRGGRPRRVALSSLYADYFLNSLAADDITGMDPLEAKWSAAFDAISTDLKQASNTVPGGDMHSFVKEVAATLRETDQANDNWQVGDKLQEVLKRRREIRHGRFRGVEKGVFIRACVLAAWTQAWCEAGSDSGRCEVKPRVRGILGLLPEDGEKSGNASVNYGRLFMYDRGWNAPRTDENGEVTWARPFRPEKSQIMRWDLDGAEQASLSSFDVSLCKFFAALPENEGGLGLIIGVDVQPPTWMTIVE